MYDLRPGAKVGPYLIERVLPGGRGGMSVVYMAVAPSEFGPVRVALKIVRVPDTENAETIALYHSFVEAMHNEVDILSRLSHPGIVHLFPSKVRKQQLPYIMREPSLPGQPWYYVMEYLAGGTLEDVLKKKGKLPIPQAVEVIHQAAQALEYCHMKGIFHGDIKPKNIMFRKPWDLKTRPEVVITDFGTARQKGQARREAGTLPYMSPERLRAETDSEVVIDAAASDIYSLGVTLYFAITGKLPFDAYSESKLSTAILTKEPTPLSQYVERDQLPEELEKLVLQTLDKNPANRPTAAEFLHKLDLFMPPPRYVPDEAGLRAVHPPARSNKWAVLSAGLVLVVLLETYALLARPFTWQSSVTPPDATPTFQPVIVAPTPTAQPTRTATPPAVIIPPSPTTHTVAPAPTTPPAVQPTQPPTATPVQTFTPSPTPRPTSTPTTEAPVVPTATHTAMISQPTRPPPYPPTPTPTTPPASVLLST